MSAEISLFVLRIIKAKRKKLLKKTNKKCISVEHTRIKIWEDK